MIFFAILNLPYMAYVSYWEISGRLSKDPAQYNGICSAWADYSRPCTLEEWLWWNPTGPEEWSVSIFCILIVLPLSFLVFLVILLPLPWPKINRQQE